MVSLKTTIVLASITLLYSVTIAQTDGIVPADKDSNLSNQTNQIFTSIMQSMSSDMRASVDSASSATDQNRKPQKDEADKSRTKDNLKVQNENRNGALNELPEEIRERVQQRIVEIEKKNEERSLQFKEQKKHE